MCNDTGTIVRRNISGSRKRFLQDAVRRVLTEELHQLNGDEGEKLEQRLDWLLEDIQEAVLRCAGKHRRIISSVSSHQIGAIAEKEAIKCFTGELWGTVLVNRFSTVEPSTEPCKATILHIDKTWSFAEAALIILGLPSDGQMPAEHLGRLVLEKDYALTLSQIEKIAEMAMRGDGVELSKCGDNYAFVKGKREESEYLSIVRVEITTFGNRRKANVATCSFGYQVHPRGYEGSRLILHNPDSSEIKF